MKPNHTTAQSRKPASGPATVMRSRLQPEHSRSMLVRPPSPQKVIAGRIPCFLTMSACPSSWTSRDAVTATQTRNAAPGPAPNDVIAKKSIRNM